ncbi:DUF1000-domain-containing protein [Polyplosphaeria fusca]|uniref:DUF1000-domain-containing protein n=1 Tax=Polyplosphaeria fusca TaxID=682080 RepID=A0A9P4RBJ8_9PLEO|nr:DUF1000-domain-containing protein [Polyplosphaeria fusca]
MSSVTQITSRAQFNTLLSSSRIVVANFNTGSDSNVDGVYGALAGSLSRPNVLTFVKVDTASQQEWTQSLGVTTNPTFIVFKNGREVAKNTGISNIQRLSDTIQRLALEAESDGSSGGFGEASSSSGGAWRGADFPRGYGDVTDQIDVRGLDLLNADSGFGGVRTLFETMQPSTLAVGKGKGAATGAEAKKDWVESDVDEQLMMYIPFTSTLKVHTIHITSAPPKSEDDDETPMRPKTIHLYVNHQHNLGFEEAEDTPAIQTIELQASDWDEKTATAKLELRFVKFQKVYSLVLFVADGDGSGDKTRIDRIKIIGESGEKRDPGQLKKIDEDS